MHYGIASVFGLAIGRIKTLSDWRGRCQFCGLHGRLNAEQLREKAHVQASVIGEEGRIERRLASQEVGQARPVEKRAIGIVRRGAGECRDVFEPRGASRDKPEHAKPR